MPDLDEETVVAPSRLRGVAGTIWALEHAQDFVSITVGVVLMALAVFLVVSGVVNFFAETGPTVTQRATALLDQVLLVLILVEIAHTVVLSLRAHRLAAQPFIVVGLVAVIRRILFLLSSGPAKADTTELGLLIAMVAVFVSGLIAVGRFGNSEE